MEIKNQNANVKNYSLENKNIKNDVENRRFIPSEYKKVAESFEAQFAEQMLNEMNKQHNINNDSGDEENDSSAMNFYKSLQTTDYAQKMAQQNNLGLQKVILNQIYPQRLRNEIVYNQYERQKMLKDQALHHKNLPTSEVAEKSAMIGIGLPKDSTNSSSPGDKK